MPGMSDSFAEIALPVPLRATFSYVVPPALRAAVCVGSRVVVPFGKRHLVGVVLRLFTEAPEATKLKEIGEVLDAVPTLPPALVALGRWVSGYYVAPPGEVFRSLLPPAVELRRERRLALTDSGREGLAQPSGGEPLSQELEAERAVLTLFSGESGKISPATLRKLPGGAEAVERLVARGWLAWRQFVRHRRERTQKIVAVDPRGQRPAAEGAEARLYELLASRHGPLPLAAAAREAGISRSAILRLGRAGRLVVWDEPVSAPEDLWEIESVAPICQLNAAQTSAAAEMDGWLAAGGFQVGLLYGVTASGKTEVYLRAIEAALGRGRSALLLVPEIALTLAVSRLARARFGDTVAVLHSGLGDNERAREWWRVRQGEARLVVGTRSAVFAPLENLGLVIVDEEQEASYKQNEAPRYHGRDTAIMRAKLERALALLGSATPSLESFHHARQGKYRLIELGGRVENRPLARVEIVDLREEFRQAERALPVSNRLVDAIAARLERGQQALVLINRRGYSWFVLCRSCGAAVECRNCSIALTYHKRRGRLLCHYCGFAAPVPKLCPKCRSEHLYFFGEGAEHIEEYLSQKLPRARIARLDRDTVGSRRAYQQVLGAFAAGSLDLLVGTQMVAKGHDFQRVTLVGVVSGDRTLALPDFRAAERTFQLLTQVAGRAGRGDLPGEVLVETYHPEHYAIQHAARQDYPSFFEQELRFRRLMHYPPFTALANVLVREKRLERAIAWARALGGFFAAREPQELKVLGPAAAPLARLKSEYRYQFLLKSPSRARLVQTLAACLDFCARKEIPERAVLVDVDPVALF
jgi:primosomal protein N' (replication factor Y) (superfamily II helicase)